MSDLLGSLLKNMEKPPSSCMRADQKAAKKQEEAMRKMMEEEKKQLKEFKKKIEQRVEEFIADESKSSLKFEPMDKVHRTIVHDVCDAADLSAFSFGLENVDRHTVIYKRDSIPSEEELTALRKGQVYDPEKAKLMQILEKKEELDAQKKQKITPATNYRDKYEHLIGKDAGKKAAVVTKLHEQFGLVPTALKRDQRSIEEALNDIRKKKLKQEQDALNCGVSSSTDEPSSDQTS